MACIARMVVLMMHWLNLGLYNQWLVKCVHRYYGMQGRRQCSISGLCSQGKMHIT